MKEGSVGHPYLTALLLLAMIGGFYVSGGNNLSTINPKPNEGEVVIVPPVIPQKAKDNIQLYTFGHFVAAPSAIPGASGSGVIAPTFDPDQPAPPLPDCPSHGIKTPTCNCPTREEVWAYCDIPDISTCEAPGIADTIPVPGKNPPGKQFCRYSQEPDSPIYQQKLQDSKCTLACVN